MSTLSVQSITGVSSFDFSNTTFANAYNVANSGYVVANAGFGKANTALQNTSGTFAGNLNLTGSLGLNVTSPSFSIDALSSTNAGRFINSANTNQGASFRFNTYGTDEFSITATRESSGNTQSLVLAGQDNLKLYTSGAERGRFDSSGYFMVNRSTRMYGGAIISANGWLAVKQTGADAYGFVAEALNNDRWIRIGHDGNNAIVGSTYNVTGGFSPLTFATSDQERMRIAANGMVSLTTALGVPYGGTGRSTSLAYCLAYNNTDSSTFGYSGATQKVNFNTASLDNVSGFNGTNNRYTVVSGYAGTYKIDINVQLRWSTGGLMNNGWWMIYKNGSAITYNQTDANGKYYYSIPMVASYILNLSVGDYIEFFVGYDSQGDGTTRAYFVSGRNFMMIQQIA